jgi:hypothetical protein
MTTFSVNTLLRIATVLLIPLVAAGQEATQFDKLHDRGDGVTTSLFGTYIKSGQWMLYPFYEYARNDEEEYHPSELGFVGEEDFLGKSTEHEFVLFVAYGFSDTLAFELEAEMYVDATLQKSPADMSNVPPQIQEAGFAGAEAQLRWMWREETDEKPGLYSFFEVEIPFQDTNVLIGATDVEFALGTGFVRAYTWGTLNGRVSLAYDGAEGQVELGEYALEYLKRLNDRWRMVATIEGEDDDLSLIGEAQWFLRENAIVKLNSGFGITGKAADVAPEIGILFTF